MSQAQRDKVMQGFRKGTTEILIATDVAARGIDVDDVEAVHVQHHGVHGHVVVVLVVHLDVAQEVV